MSGHSHWATIRRKKGAEDAKRGKIFTRLAHELTMAAREGGGDPDMNPRLALAIEKAKAGNMPKDRIERAIKRGTGEDKDASALEEIIYEGYAPHGVALMIECVTDNRNRSVSELRHILSRDNGHLGEMGSVAWQFDRKAYFAFSTDKMDYDTAFELAIEAGADDVLQDGDTIEIIGPVESYKEIADGLKKAGVTPDESGLRMMPKQEISVGVDETLQVLKVIEALEELDDVQNVYHNLQISDDALSALENA